MFSYNVVLESKEILELFVAAYGASQAVWNDDLLWNDCSVDLANPGPSRKCHVLSRRFLVLSIERQTGHWLVTTARLITFLLLCSLEAT